MTADNKTNLTEHNQSKDVNLLLLLRGAEFVSQMSEGAVWSAYVSSVAVTGPPPHSLNDFYRDSSLCCSSCRTYAQTVSSKLLCRHVEGVQCFTQYG